MPTWGHSPKGTRTLRPGVLTTTDHLALVGPMRSAMGASGTKRNPPNAGRWRASLGGGNWCRLSGCRGLYLPSGLAAGVAPTGRNFSDRLVWHGLACGLPGDGLGTLGAYYSTACVVGTASSWTRRVGSSSARGSLYFGRLKMSTRFRE